MREILSETNPWEKGIDYGVDRLFFYPEIVSFLFRKEIQVLSGIRRCGKTTLLYQCMQYYLANGIKKEQILFISCDDPRLKLTNFEALDKLLSQFKTKEKLFVFLDEIQEVKGWEKYLKARYDANTNLKFLISGSTASFFEADVASYLTGRYIFHKISTLTFKEYTHLKPLGSFIDYLEWGGFPEVVRATLPAQKQTLLRNYLNTVLHKDIIERNKLRNKKTVIRIVESLLLASGGKINIEHLANQFKVSRNTITRYCELCVDAFLLAELDFFSNSPRKNRHMQTKMYPVDIGFTRLLSGRFEQGRACEWAVMITLNTPIYYWSDVNHEVDFVTKDLAIQVTFTDDVAPREFEALIYFKKISSKKGLVLAKSTTDKTTAVEGFLIEN